VAGSISTAPLLFKMKLQKLGHSGHSGEKVGEINVNVIHAPNEQLALFVEIARYTCFEHTNTFISHSVKLERYCYVGEFDNIAIKFSNFVDSHLAEGFVEVDSLSIDSHLDESSHIFNAFRARYCKLT